MYFLLTNNVVLDYNITFFVSMILVGFLLIDELKFN